VHVVRKAAFILQQLLKEIFVAIFTISFDIKTFFLKLQTYMCDTASKVVVTYR